MNPAWASTESPTSLQMTERQPTTGPADAFPGATTTSTKTSDVTGPSPITISKEDTGIETETTQFAESSPFVRKTWCEFITSSSRRDGLVTLVLILSNIDLGWYAVYPFVVFSKWIHETCHGMAELLVGLQRRQA